MIIESNTDLDKPSEQKTNADFEQIDASNKSKSNDDEVLEIKASSRNLEEKVEKLGEPIPKEPWIDKAEKKPPPQSDNDPSVKKNEEQNPVS